MITVSYFTQLSHNFLDQNDASRRRREANYDNVYVEQFVYVGEGRATTVVFAVAQKPSYELIPASKACDLLKGTDVKCSSDGGNTSADTGAESADSKFPLWVIYIIAGLIVVAFLIMIIVLRKRNARKVCAKTFMFPTRSLAVT